MESWEAFHYKKVGKLACMIGTGRNTLLAKGQCMLKGGSPNLVGNANIPAFQVLIHSFRGILAQDI